MHTTDPATQILIEGEDWEGNPVKRAIRAGMQIALRGKYGEGFDIRGPQAWMCPECEEVRYMPTGGHVLIGAQRHLWDEHKVSAAVLPR